MHGSVRRVTLVFVYGVHGIAVNDGATLQALLPAKFARSSERTHSCGMMIEREWTICPKRPLPNPPREGGGSRKVCGFCTLGCAWPRAKCCKPRDSEGF